MIRRQRKKAFIGAIIQGVGGIVGGFFNRRAQKEAERKKKIEQGKADSLEAANNLTEGYADQSYADAFKTKVVGKCGGNFKNDRIRRARKFKHGGRIKMGEGGDLVANIFAAGQIQQYTHDDGSTSVKKNKVGQLKKKKEADTLPQVANQDTPANDVKPMVNEEGDVVQTNAQNQQTVANGQQVNQSINNEQEQQNLNSEQQQQEQRGSSANAKEAIGAGVNTAVNLLTQNNNYDDGSSIKPTAKPQLKRKTYDRLNQAKLGKRIYLK